MTTTEIEKQPEQKHEVLTKAKQGMVPANLDEMYRMASALSRSGMVPKHFDTPEKIMACMQYCYENGMKPTTSMQWMYVINGRVAVWGDAVAAKVHASGLVEYDELTFEHDGTDDMVAVYTIKRKDRPNPHVSRFSVQDAKDAGLWGKAGPWKQYKKRMLGFRAKHFGWRDHCPDVLMGMRIAEEVMDYPDVQPDPTPALPPTGRIPTRTVSPSPSVMEQVAPSGPLQPIRDQPLTGEVIDVESPNLPPVTSPSPTPEASEPSTSETGSESSENGPFDTEPEHKIEVREVFEKMSERAFTRVKTIVEHANLKLGSETPDHPDGKMAAVGYLGIGGLKSLEDNDKGAVLVIEAKKKRTKKAWSEFIAEYRKNYTKGA